MPVDAAVTAYYDEAGYRNALSSAGYSTVSENFDGAAWGSVRSPIGGNHVSAPSVTSNGIAWSSFEAPGFGAANVGVTTSTLGGADYYLFSSTFRTYEFQSYYDHVFPDRLNGTSSAALYGIGGWFRGTPTLKVQIYLNGATAPAGEIIIPDSGQYFLGVVETNGFTSFAIKEAEGIIFPERKFMFVDNVTVGKAGQVSCDPATHVPIPTTCGSGVCAASGQTSCVDGQIVDSCVPGQATGLDDDCNGLDENCNGTADENYVATGCVTGLPGVCAPGATACVGGQAQCVQNVPPGTETPAVAGSCFDGQDNDCDGLIDCADQGCANAAGNACVTGVPGICSDGTLTCIANNPTVQCVQNQQTAVELFNTATCGDGLDNDCDSLVDAADPGCTPPAELCFNGTDDDGDTFVDCLDPDCAGARNGPCDSGIPGVCATGQVGCLNGSAQCLQTVFPQTEALTAGNTCGDGLDNDCDALVDSLDPGCMPPETACFDGQDNDLDGLPDCADPDCSGAQDGVCGTGLPGICSAGTLACQGGNASCVQTQNGVLEAFNAGNCSDGLDNDCDGFVDASDPGCTTPDEICFNGMDDDFDGLADCADPNCEGARGDPCSSGLPGICSAGTVTCQQGNASCIQNQQGVPEVFDAGNCGDGLDNDCDSFIDAVDPGCIAPVEVCFNGMDDDLDGLADCADPDCDGKTDGPCATGLPGICSAGTVTCQGVAVACVQNLNAAIEAIAAGTCSDGQDNDCDGFMDGTDPGCAVPGDLDGDRDVDHNDQKMFLKSFRKCRGNPAYNPAADYDNDGCVAQRDYQKWHGHFKSFRNTAKK